jgi:hypothetical protein
MEEEQPAIGTVLKTRRQYDPKACIDLKAVSANHAYDGYSKRNALFLSTLRMGDTSRSLSAAINA